MADEFWETAKQFSTNQKPFSKGFILKSDFCKKYNVSVADFEKRLIELGHKKKCGLTIGGKFVKKRSGSWQKGIYQYKESYFKELFGTLTL